MPIINAPAPSAMPIELPTVEMLPPLYARWMDTLLTAPIPAESSAPCSDCAMCAPEASGPERRLEFFDPHTKCCTYMPSLWNFLVGRLLDDDDPALAHGRATVEARIAAGQGVTPLGLRRTAGYALLYDHMTPAWGRSVAMRCPHYVDEDGGRCGVWRHRESTCATWFCKHVRGAVGRTFWLRLHTLLRVAELAVARWCVAELDVGADAMARLFPHLEHRGPAQLDADTLDGTVNADELRALWGAWAGREHDFYRAAGRLASAMEWRDVEPLGGAELAVHARLTREAHQQLLSRELPPALHVGRIQAEPTSGGYVVVNGYSPLDGLRLPGALLAALHRFDGRPTADAMDAIAREDGLRLTPELVRKLVDFEVLVG